MLLLKKSMVMKMKNKMILKILLIGLSVLCFMSCAKKEFSDINRSTVGSLNAWAPVWYVYEDNLNIDGGELFKHLTSIKENSLSGVFVDYRNGDNKCIRFYWDGSLGIENEVPYDTISAYGFSFSFEGSVNGPRDMSGASYDKVAVKLKGFLGDDVTLEIKCIGSDTDKIILTKGMLSENEYSEFVITLTEGMSNVTDIISFYLKYNIRDDLECQGAEIYIDDISFINNDE